jgi:hypothetical protein
MLGQKWKVHDARTPAEREFADGPGRAIVAGIIVARRLKTADDLFDSKSSPRTEALVAAAVQWAE